MVLFLLSLGKEREREFVEPARKKKSERSIPSSSSCSFFFTFRVVVVVFEVRILSVDLLVRILEAIVCVCFVLVQREKEWRKRCEREEVESELTKQPSNAKASMPPLFFFHARETLHLPRPFSRQTHLPCRHPT